MATVHIPEADALRNFAEVMAHVRAGSEVIIEKDALAVAVVKPPASGPGLLLSEAIALAEARGSGIALDGGFEQDVLAAIEAHREPLDPPAWD
ncbi:MAG: hypothetical protein WCE75_05230 [Terracidiphilus sp.]